MKKYDAIAVELEQKIKSGALRASERLRSQSDLATEYGVSVGTVQKSLKILENNGLIMSVHGSGTYVTTGSPESEEVVNFRFIDENKRVLPVFLKVEEINVINEDGPWRQHLGEGETIEIRRIANIDLQFSALNTIYLVRRDFDMLLSLPLYRLDGHELTMLIDRQNMESDHFVYQLKGGVLSDRTCIINHLDVKSQGLHWEIFAYTAANQPNWYQRIELPLTGYSLEIFASGRKHIKQQMLDTARRQPMRQKREVTKKTSREDRALLQEPK
ncbi:GntR family transcriptional regulator [Mesorhizobium shangrilense]|uniref:GntR family transcriptional regulator n=1 Tax=Mesorhizobium shangrilense TaxID=460060 RepID=A0ABV2DGU9_9HYPH